MARVVLARSASVALKDLDHLVADAVVDALGELERDPMVGHALRGRLTGPRSYRVGVYRIIYQLRDESTVRVVAIGHRGSVHDRPTVTAGSTQARRHAGLGTRIPDRQR
ncbi:hypothetical protein BH23ACT10_BH23ACT10_22990 [soil metagenome]